MAFRMGISGEWLASVAQTHAEILVLQSGFDGFMLNERLSEHSHVLK